MKKKNYKEKIISKCFLIVFMLFSFIPIIYLLIGSNKYNLLDNRMSYKAYMPTLKSFYSSEFQNDLEEAIADQMPKYKIFKLGYSSLSNYVNLKTISLLNVDKDRYIKLGNNINLYNDYLVYDYLDYDNITNLYSDNITKINKLVMNSDANIYFYFIETDSIFDFANNKKTDVMKYLSDNLIIDKNKMGVFDISSFDEYKKYFYISDHHWNYIGAYKGYTDIAKLMHFDNIIEINDTLCLDNIKYFGSKARQIGDQIYFDDVMCLYTYDYPNYDIYVSGEYVNDIGKSLNKIMNADYIAYDYIYGKNVDVNIFINEDIDSSKKLLVYSNSYMNIIKKLLAANYKETHYINGRHYKDKDLVDYIKENEIDDVLIIGNHMYLSDNLRW